MAFTDSHRRCASFGVVTNLPDDVIDSIWYNVDVNLWKPSIPPTSFFIIILQTSLKIKKSKLISENMIFDTFFSKKVYISLENAYN